MSECPKCKGTGLADSGGVQPWGEPILIECDCKNDESIMEESRNQFEYLAGKALNLPTSIIELARKGDGYDHAFDSMNIMQPLNGWWNWWKKSRAAIEIELPKYHDYTSQDTTRAQAEKSAYNSGIYDSAEAIRAAGLKIKGE